MNEGVFSRERFVLGEARRIKNLIVAFGVSLAVCLASMYGNYRAYRETNYLAWSHRVHGGEITVEFAPGWHAVHTYGMTPEEKDAHNLVFSPVALAVSLLALTLVGWAALAKFSTGEPCKDFFLLLAGWAVLFFAGWAITEFE